MTVFVDTSALVAQLSLTDANHERSASAFEDLIRTEDLLTHNYVILETAALVQARLGLEAARALVRDIAPLIDVRWVDEAIHDAAVISLLAASRREVSLVDWTSFEVMRRAGVDVAFTFDRDFARQGFRMVP